MTSVFPIHNFNADLRNKRKKEYENKKNCQILMPHLEKAVFDIAYKCVYMLCACVSYTYMRTSTYT